MQYRFLNAPEIFIVVWNLELCHPCCVCENWKVYVVKHNYVN